MSFNDAVDVFELDLPIAHFVAYILASALSLEYNPVCVDIHQSRVRQRQSLVLNQCLYAVVRCP